MINNDNRWSNRKRSLNFHKEKIHFKKDDTPILLNIVFLTYQIIKRSLKYWQKKDRNEKWILSICKNTILSAEAKSLRMTSKKLFEKCENETSSSKTLSRKTLISNSRKWKQRLMKTINEVMLSRNLEKNNKQYFVALKAKEWYQLRKSFFPTSWVFPELNNANLEVYQNFVFNFMKVASRAALFHWRCLFTKNTKKLQCIIVKEL